MNFPDEIETERLKLRPLRAADAGPMALYAGDRRVAEMLEHLPHPYPPGAAEAFIERVAKGKADEHVWAMDATKIGSAEFVGVIGVKTAQDPPQLGYWVGPPFWNTGYASEAARAVVAAAREAGAAALDARIVAANEASAHVLTNAGFRETGRAEFFGVAANRMLPHRLFSLVFAEAPA
ncbi:MAG: GNAT family N-acetyltransferase [Pseudomonadota bacterium]